MCPSILTQWLKQGISPNPILKIPKLWPNGKLRLLTKNCPQRKQKSTPSFCKPQFQSHVLLKNRGFRKFLFSFLWFGIKQPKPLVSELTTQGLSDLFQGFRDHKISLKVSHHRPQ